MLPAIHILHKILLLNRHFLPRILSLNTAKELEQHICPLSAIYHVGGDTPSSNTILGSTILIKTLDFSRIIEHLSTLWLWTPTFSIFVHKPYILFRAPHDSKRCTDSRRAVVPSTISLPDFEPCFPTSCQLSFGSVPGIQRYLAQSADRLPLKIFHRLVQAIVVQAAENHYKQDIPPLIYVVRARYHPWLLQESNRVCEWMLWFLL